MLREKKESTRNFLPIAKALPATLLVLLALAMSGCQFFGKQHDNPAQSTPGLLADGTSFVGSWSTSYSSVDAGSKPSIALTTTFTFDPTSGVRVEERDAHAGTTVCTAFGQYRLLNGSDIIIYLQAAQPTTCAFPAQMYLSKISVTTNYLAYTDPTSGNPGKLYPDHAQANAPVGLWEFDGQGGIDYLFLDQHGYFVLQTTAGGTQYLLQGFYQVSSGTITLSFMANGDPGQVAGTTIFTGFVANDQALRLIQTTTNGDLAYDGIRL